MTGLNAFQRIQRSLKMKAVRAAAYSYRSTGMPSYRKGQRRQPLLFYLCVFCCIPVFFVLGFYATCSCVSPTPRLQKNAASFIQYFPHREFRTKETKTVLIWDPKFPFAVNAEGEEFMQCPEKRCRITRDRGELRNSDAVIFSSRGLWNTFVPVYTMPPWRHPTDSRGLWNTFLPVYTMPTWRHPHQVWIISEMEAPPETILDWSKYNGLFNWTLHYRKDADLVGSYGRFERLDMVGDQSAKNQSSEKNARNFFAEKTGMVAWMSSNCVDDARRQRVVHELARYIQVDTYGGCGDNKATGCSDHQCSKHLDKYRFFLSLENANCRDYFTEKLYHAYDRDQIPITNNDAHSSGVAPNGSYIQISDFSSLEHLAKYLKKLASNATAYNSYLSWRQTHRVLTYAAPMCELCKRLHDGSKPAQVYADLYGWLANDSCQPWSICNYVRRLTEGMALYFRLIN